MFEKILIANRGEIAARVIATARRMGIATVAVYSDADRDARHVALAGEAVRIGPPPAAESYLAIEALIRACNETGAEAVHPGYGFLSEQAAFAYALEKEGIVFIGPNPKAIELMGDKIEAKKLARTVGIAGVPGFYGVIQDAREAAEIAEAIGYPVIIKAAAGGGGRGMRIVASESEVEDNFARAQSEALSAFGDERVFIEKFIESPRHIEIQVLGDKHGNIIHLGERECSIQRRHQKIIEEAPSPFVDPQMREAMASQSITLAKAVNYDSAGTVEFIVAQDKTFYFLEMNTRLQVEHPVTERITGVDLVEQMIRSAAGERLQLTPPAIRGWAVEARVLAEDPARGFLPSAGRLRTYREPAAGPPGAATPRIDTGVCEGSEIPLHYDSLIAKVIAHAQDRDAAIKALAQAIDEFAIEGVSTNLVFLAAVLRSARFLSGELSTAFIAHEYPHGFTPQTPDQEIARKLVCVVAVAAHVMEERRRTISGQLHPRSSLLRECSVMLGKARFDVHMDRIGSGIAVMFEGDGKALLCSSDWRPGFPVFEGTIDGEPIAVRVRPILNGFHLEHGGAAAEARVYSRREAELAALMQEKKTAGRAGALRSPMPAIVKSIAATPGQAVKEGDVLCVIEAMKMETALRAERKGNLVRIHVKVGDAVAADSIIMEFE